MSAYPPAPWRLLGNSIQGLALVDIERVRAMIPADLRIVPVAPRRTLGALYCASYDSRSTRRYHELIVAPALAAARGRIGFWISEIYVDDADSQAAGREIWGLPKQLADFQWRPHEGLVLVARGSELVVRIEWRPKRGSLPAPLWAPVLTRRESELLSFRTLGRCSAALTRGGVTCPTESVLHTMDFAGSRRLVLANELRLTIHAPSISERSSLASS